MKITRPKRRRSGAKRIDLTDMRALFRDRRVWCGLGIVIEPDGDPHWSIVTNEIGARVDIVVEVELQPSQTPITARLRAGMWEVPAVGDEVAVLVPDGEISFQPIIIARLSSGVVPSATQGPEPGRILLVPQSGQEVLVHDGNGGAEPLVKRSEFLKHGHATAGTGSPSVPIDISPAVGSALTFPGTSVLKAK